MQWPHACDLMTPLTFVTFVISKIRKSLSTYIINKNVTLTKARFPFKRNRLRCVRCVNENRKKRKRLRWQAANHGCHCFVRSFLLADACVCCVKFSLATYSAIQNYRSNDCFLSRDPILLTKAFCTFVRPVFEYSSTIWNPVYKYDIIILVRTDRQTESQRQMVAILTRLPSAGVTTQRLAKTYADKLVTNEAADVTPWVVAVTPPWCPNQ